MNPTPDRTAVTALSRLVDRLRSLPESRLAASVDSLGGQRLSDAVFECSCWCVAAEAGVVDRGADAAPPARALPRLADLSAGDQLWVVCHDLLIALAAVPAADQVWQGSERVTAGSVRAELDERLAALRAVV